MKRSLKIATVVLSILVVAFFNTPAFAEGTGKIAGRVGDAETGMELSGASIRTEGTAYENMVGPDGLYFIINVPPGTYTLRVSHLGYKTMTISDVTVLANITTEVNIKLQSLDSYIPNARIIHQAFLKKMKIKTEQIDPLIDSLESYLKRNGLVVDNTIATSLDVKCDTAPYNYCEQSYAKALGELVKLSPEFIKTLQIPSTLVIRICNEYGVDRGTGYICLDYQGSVKDYKDYLKAALPLQNNEENDKIKK